MHRVLVTGATGFIGSFLCKRLLDNNMFVRGTLLPSEVASSLVPGVQPALIEPLGSETSWDNSLAGIDTVVHLAARVHIMEDTSSDPLSEFRRINVDGTARLARESVKMGVKRLVFVSSIKVNGEETVFPYTSESQPVPTDDYGISKWEAEQALRKIECETGLEVVVVRPTLVYGPGVKANFLNLLDVVYRGFPLPLSSISNLRSFIFVGNLVDALVKCTVHPAAAGNTYLVSDGEDVSTPELIRRTAVSLGVKERLFAFPVNFMKLVGVLMGKSGAVNRLTGSLTVDGSKIRQELNWNPPFSLEHGMRETALWYLNKYRKIT